MQSDSQKRETGDDRRAAIAAATRALIVEKGLEGLRMRDIAASVGINIATLHYHVPSKEALIELVAQSLKTEFRTQGMSRSRHGKSGLERLHMEFEDVLETQEQAPERLAVMAQLAERASRDAAIGAIMQPLRAHWHASLTAVFAAGAADGSMRADIDAEAAAQIFIGMVVGWRSSRPDRAQMLAVFAEFERAFAVRSGK